MGHDVAIPAIGVVRLGGRAVAEGVPWGDAVHGTAGCVSPPTI